jgi:hypothetical protein
MAATAKTSFVPGPIQSARHRRELGECVTGEADDGNKLMTEAELEKLFHALA